MKIGARGEPGRRTAMAKKDVSAIVSGMGVGLSILTSFIEKARKRGLGDEVIHQLATPEGDLLLDKFVDLMEGSNGKPGSSFPITVNYDSRLERMIEDGKYDWKNPDITEKNFPSDAKGTVGLTIELVHFNKVMESDEIQKKLDKQGLRPATLPELLAFGAKYPEKQRELPIVALGSVWRGWDGYRNVAYLYRYGSGRDLRLGCLGDGWDAYYRFAAVRKSV
jgi:hypothetical protein